jgi:hypothetical protein
MHEMKSMVKGFGKAGVVRAGDLFGGSMMAPSAHAAMRSVFIRPHRKKVVSGTLSLAFAASAA